MAISLSGHFHVAFLSGQFWDGLEAIPAHSLPFYSARCFFPQVWMFYWLTGHWTKHGYINWSPSKFWWCNTKYIIEVWCNASSASLYNNKQCYWLHFCGTWTFCECSPRGQFCSQFIVSKEKCFTTGMSKFNIYFELHYYCSNFTRSISFRQPPSWGQWCSCTFCRVAEWQTSPLILESSQLSGYSWNGNECYVPLFSSVLINEWVYYRKPCPH